MKRLIPSTLEKLFLNALTETNFIFIYKIADILVMEIIINQINIVALHFLF